jgi:enamine deaminase RidA (YjgF/YER057c/UK114 family)
MAIEDKLKELELALPVVGKPGGNYVPAVRSGNILFISGQIPAQDGKIMIKGLVGGEIPLERGQKAAQLAVLNALAVAKAELGSLDNVSRVLRMTVYVNSMQTFTQHSLVANGASDLLVNLFGDAGRHARSAIGLASLPGRSSVEIELTLEVK